MPIQNERRATIRHWPVLLLTVCALIALAFIWHALQERRHDGVHEVFTNEARRISTKIDERLGAYGQILRSGAGLFATSNSVDRKGWEAFVEKLDLDQNYRGVQGVGYSTRVLKKDLNAHLAEMHRQGFPDYVVKPIGERDEYTAIVFLEPFSGRNLRAFGYDMYSEATRNSAMSLARDVGDVAFSGKVKLLQETKNDVQAGILAYFPVYRNNTITQTVEQRRQAIVGWVYSPYRMNDMMIPIVGKELDGVRLEIFDGEQASDESLLFDSEFGNQLGQSISASGDAMVVTRKLELPGRYWTLRFTALPGFAQAQRFSSPLIEAGALWTIGLLVVGLAAALIATGSRAQQIAEVLTGELRMAATVFHHSREGILIADANGLIVDVNDAFSEITGYARDEAIGRNPSLLASGRHSAEFFSSMWRQLGSELAWEGEVWNRRKSGEIYAELLNISAVTDEAGGVSHYVGIFMDITMRKSQEERLEQMAHYDPLTTLPNRLLFDDRLRQAMAQAKRRACQLAVVYIDLDGFKAVNDQYGHEAGDVLLVNVAYRLRDALREGDSIARTGGDEFVAVLPDLADFSDVEHLMDRLLMAASAPVHHGSHVLQVSASIGVAMFQSGEGVGGEELMHRADKAMYQAKHAGKNKYAMFSPGMD